jgi:hypothetical protein
MPMGRRPDETREAFMSRCIPVEIRAGKGRDQAIAICASKFSEYGEVEEPDVAATKGDSFKPNTGMVKEAKLALEWRSEFGRGGTPVGIARARDIANGSSLSYDTVKRMKAFFDRHQKNKSAGGYRPGEKGYPSNGRIAWALWGGDAGYSWAKAIVRRVEGE